MSLSKVLHAAIDEVGYKEGANNDNKFAKIAGHANNLPWCATFVRACFVSGEEAKAIPNTAYCPHIEAWGRQHNRIIRLEQAQKGDLVLFDFTRKGRADHVGILINNYDPLHPDIVRTIEGNTGAQSQTNGDGVARKTRAVSLIRVIVRPNWSK